MERLTDLAAFRWIEGGLAPRHEHGVTVSECIPSLFKAYCKILHPIQAYSLNCVLPVEITPLTIARDLRTLDPQGWLEVQVGQSLSACRAEPLRWKELVRRFGMKWVPEISSHSFLGPRLDGWPVCVEPPSQGQLEPSILEHLMEVLSPFTPHGECFFYFFPLETEDFEPKLFRGELREAGQAFEGVQESYTPTYWWPPSHAWCLCTDYDLDFSVFGGSADVVRTLLDDPLLECVEVSPETRVDNRADLSNAAVSEAR